MADSRRAQLSLVPLHSATHHDVTPLTAAAQLLQSSDTPRQIQGEGWQNEAWDFYQSLGELNYGVEWFSQALSRIRLQVAEVTPGGDEPKPIMKGPAAEIIERLAGGTAGQAAMLKSFGVQLAVPGDGYLVGRQIVDDAITTSNHVMLLDAEPDEQGLVWTVQPIDTLRQSRRSIKNLIGGRHARGWEVQLDDTYWEPLPAESLVCRIWDRNERLPWRANSSVRAALPIMREIDMYNRYIMAILVSRVALNGLLLIPDEVTLPSNPNYENAADPFIAELLDLMRAAIKNPGSAAAAAPAPLRIPSEYIDKFKHLTFASSLDDKIYEARISAIRRLATTLNLPQEVLTGMGESNHWSAWEIKEDAIKIHISPKIEIITRCLTQGYLHPMLKAAGEKTTTSDGSKLIVWYDASELTQRPDRSEAARMLRDQLVITDVATRRENGFDESDKPTDDELERMVLMKLAVNPQTAAPAIKALTGLVLESPQQAPVAGAPPPNSGPGGGVGAEPNGSTPTTAPVTGPPKTQGESPPAPDEGIPSGSGDIAAAALRISHSPSNRSKSNGVRR